MRCKNFIVAVGILVWGSSYGWWDANWQYRKAIQVVNRNPNTQYAYPIKVQLGAGIFIYSHADSTGKDIRFVKKGSQPGDELSYYIQKWDTTGTSEIWVKMDTLRGDPADSFLTDTIYIYYGNPVAANNSNGYDVFTYFEDFFDADVADWILDALYCAGSSRIADNWKKYTPPYSMKIQVNGDNYSNNEHYVRYKKVFTPALDSTNYEMRMWMFKVDVSTCYGSNVRIDNTVSPWFYANNGFITPLAYTGSINSIAVHLNICNEGYYTPSVDSVFVDDIFIRKTTSPDPTTNILPTEESVIALSYLNIAPATCLPGELVGIERVTLSKPTTPYPQWTNLRIDLVGTGNEADITEARLYEDDGDNTFEPDSDNLITVGPFTSGVAQLTFSKTISTAKSYFIAYKISPNAVYNHTVGAQWLTSNYYTFSSGSLPTTYFEFHSNNVLIGASIVLTEWYNIAPTYAVPGQPEVPMIKLILKTNTLSAIVNRLRLDLTQGAPSDVTQIQLFQDTNLNGKFDGSSVDAAIMAEITPAPVCTLNGVANTSTTPATYFVAFDVPPACALWTTVEFQAVNKTYMNTTSATHQVSPFNFPFEAGVVIYKGIILEDSSIVPACVVPGQTDVPFFKVSLKTELGTAKWYKVRFNRTGSGTDAYLQSVKLYEDSDDNESFDPISDAMIGTGNVVSGIAEIGFDTVQLSTTKKTYFVAADIATGGVQSGKTIGLQCPSFHYVETTPCVVYAYCFPFSAQTQIGIEATVGAVALAPAAVDVGQQNVGMGKVTLWTQSGTITWTALKLDFTGTNASNVSNVELYADTNRNNIFEASIDRRISQAPFTNDTVRLALSPTQTIDTTHKNYFVVFDISPTATEGNLVGINCPEDYYFTFSGSTCLAFNFNEFTDTTRINGILIVEPRAVAPAKVYPGQANVAMEQLKLHTTYGNVQWQDVKIDLIGQGADSGDVKKVKLYFDNGDTSAFNGTEPLIGSGVFSATNTVTLNITDQALNTNRATYWIVFDIDSNADVCDSVGPACITTSYFITDDQVRTSTLNFPFLSGTQIGGNVTITHLDDISPDTVGRPQENVLMEKLTLKTNGGQIAWEKLRVDYKGWGVSGPNPNDVDLIKLWYDANSNDTLEVATDIFCGSGDFGGIDTVLIDIIPDQIITSTPKSYFITYDVSATAVRDDSIGVYGVTGYFRFENTTCYTVDPVSFTSNKIVISPTGVEEHPITLPKEYVLFAPIPNPSTGNMTVKFGLPEQDKVELAIYNIVGQKVETLIDREVRSAGYYSIAWQNGERDNFKMKPGVYFVVLRTEKCKKIQKFTIL